jgi:DNA-binding CsgD family transcriptional regulator
MATLPTASQAHGGRQPDDDLAHALASGQIVLLASEQDPDQLVGMPIRALEVLATQLLRQPFVGSGQVRQTLPRRLAQLVERLLAAQAVALLLPDKARGQYVVVREAATGVWLPGFDAIPVAAAPLPRLLALGAGMLLNGSNAEQTLDWALRRLVGHGPALVLPIGAGSVAAGALIAQLSRTPLDGESLLALLLCRRAGAMLAGSAPAAPAAGTPQRMAPVLVDSELQSVPALSRRQLEVARLLAAGLRNKEIAAQMGIREKTVKFHLGNIYHKLGAQSRTEALLALLQHGLADETAQRTDSGGSRAVRTLRLPGLFTGL